MGLVAMSTGPMGAWLAQQEDPQLFLGEDFLPWMVLAFGAALVIGPLLALVRPPKDVAGSWYQVRKRIADMRSTLPQGVIGPVFNDDFGDVYGSIFALSADGLSCTRHAAAGPESWAAVARGRGLFVALAEAGETAAEIAGVAGALRGRAVLAHALGARPVTPVSHGVLLGAERCRDEQQGRRRQCNVLHMCSSE